MKVFNNKNNKSYTVIGVGLLGGSKIFLVKDKNGWEWNGYTLHNHYEKYKGYFLEKIPEEGELCYYLYDVDVEYSFKKSEKFPRRKLNM